MRAHEYSCSTHINGRGLSSKYCISLFFGSISTIKKLANPLRRWLWTRVISTTWHWNTEYWKYGKVRLTVQVTWMVVGLRTTGLCSRTMTSPSSFCTCLWSTPFAGGLISAEDKEMLPSPAYYLYPYNIYCTPNKNRMWCKKADKQLQFSKYYN